MPSHLTALLSILLLIIHSVVQAGGITLYEIGSPDVGFASAGWSARAEDASTAFTNPAGMTRFCSPKALIGAQPIYSDLTFQPDTQTTVVGENGTGSLWLPSGGAFYVHPFNEACAFGVSTIGYFGSKMDFNSNWVGRYYLIDTTLQGFSFIPSAACKITNKLSIGIGANVMYGIFKQKQAINNISDTLPDGRLDLSDNAFAFGCLAGILYEISPETRLGIQYLSQVSLQFRCKPHFHDLGPTLEAAIEATGLRRSHILLNANVPQTVMISLFHSISASIAFMANAGWQEWSKFQKASITLGSPTAASLTFLPKYKNTWHAAIGMRYCYSEILFLTAGYAYDSSAVSASERSLDFPVGRQRRYAAGCNWQVNENIQLGAQYEFQYQGKLSVDMNKGLLSGEVAGHYNSAIHFISLNLQSQF